MRHLRRPGAADRPGRACAHSSGLHAEGRRPHHRRGRPARAWRRGDRQRPLRRRRAPAGHYAGGAGVCGRRPGRLRGDTRAPFRRRRHGAGFHARQVGRDLPGGPGHTAGAALCARRAAGRRDAHDHGQCAHGHGEARRSQCPAGGDPYRRAATGRAGGALWCANAGRRICGDPGLCRAAHAQPHRRAAAGHVFRARLSRRRRQQRRACADQAARGRDAGSADARLRGLLGAAARQHQRRGADDAFGGVLRRQGSYRSRPFPPMPASCGP